MRTAQVVLDRDLAVGITHPRLFGAFLEHLGRCVYGGIFEPEHPDADERGFRRDVLALVRELAPTTVRNPGGNFPRQRRPDGRLHRRGGGDRGCARRASALGQAPC